MPVAGRPEDWVAASLAGYPPALRKVLLRLAPSGDGSDLARVLLDPQRIRRALEQLDEMSRHFLAFIARTGGEVSPAAADWWLRQRGCDRPASVVESVVAQGLVFHVPAARGRAWPDLPPDDARPEGGSLWPRARLWVPDPVALLATELCPVEPLTAVGEPREVTRGAPWELLRRLWLLLRCIGDHPPAMGTTSRSLNRGDVVRLARAVGLEAASGTVRRLEDMPELAWLLSLATQAQVVAHAHEGLIGVEAAGPLLEAPHSRQRRVLLEAAIAQLGWGELESAHGLLLEKASGLDAGRLDVPSPGDRVRARRHVARVLAEVAESGRWHRVEDLAEAAMRAGPDFLIRRRLGRASVVDGRARESLYRGIQVEVEGEPQPIGMQSGWPAVEGTFVARFVTESLHRVGVVDVGSTRGRLHFRVTDEGARVLGMTGGAEEEGRPPGRFFVQPNFEIVADGGGENVGAIWRLSRIAELRSHDMAAVFQLTRDSVVRALDVGVTREALLDALSDGGRVEVPQNVSYSVAEWTAAYDLYELWGDVWVIETDSPEEMTALEQELGGCLTRLAPTAGRVLPGRASAVERALARRDDVLAIDHAEGLEGVFDLDERMVATPVEPKWHWYPEHLLALIADPRPGAPTTYRLTAESVQRGLRQGLTPDEVEGFVRSCATGGLSPAQKLSLRGWLGRYGAAQLASATILSLPPETAGDLLAVPAIRELIEGWISPSVFVIRAKARGKLKRRLGEAGIEIETGLGARPLGESAPRDGEAPTGAARPWGRRRWKRGDPERDRLELIEEAIQGQVRISAAYESVIKGEAPREWVLSPQTTEVSRWGQVRLHAYCHQRQAYRTFDVSRMNQVVLLDEPAAYPPET